MSDPEHEEWLKSVQRRRLQANTEAAPLFAKQMAERDLIDAGEIDTSKGEYLARFDLSGDRLVFEIFRPTKEQAEEKE